MADTFFGFETSLNHGDHLLEPDCGDCLDTEEEEYDALNDETFGTSDDVSNLDDWEQQHEQFAEIAESKRQSEQLENSLNQLVLDDDDDLIVDASYDTYLKIESIAKKQLTTSLPFLNRLHKFCNDISYVNKSNYGHKPTVRQNALVPSSSSSPNNHGPKKICTVEELERGLLKNSSHNKHVNNVKQQQSPFIYQQPPPGRLPPGLHHPLGITPQLRPLPPPPLQNLPINYRLPHFPPGGGPPPHPPPGLFFPINSQFPINHPYNFPPPPRPPNTQNFQQMNRNNNNGHNNNHNHRRNDTNNKQRHDGYHETIKDEYSGLMTNRDKQWLLNIQLLQLNTGTPYFDDYYYTVFKERKVKTEKENDMLIDKNQRLHHNKQQKDGHHRNDGGNNQLQPRVYTPLQFENSLGKLQCGSVTAPRKIIDMDIVTLDKDVENVNTPTRDTKKIKQLLLELEAFYSLMLRAEDVKNPVAIKNMENLRQLKQKQRLREIDAASTSEQKQEILKLLQQESIPIVENQEDYFVKITNGLLQEDKFASFMNIRKGKMLLLRILPYLTAADNFHMQLLELWTKLLLSMQVIGRRDTFGENLLPKFHPYYKRFIQSCKMSDILDIVTSLIEIIRPENSRSTPLSHMGRAPLHFVASNRFGVSALVTTLVRTEYLLSSENATEIQQKDWSNFIISWAKITTNVNNVAAPLELIPLQIFVKHCNRITNLTSENKTALQKFFVDTN